ncbi:hypothetical protein A3Q56_07133 [Intoshia linei]|uniref:Uncharacterized protein n=1 Tax=Intoshia linei TaxID=1819745 RepID=A0A177ATK9_9BILA|nr:hypothetical protein A3Q56_07133 [Intoshia linei]
MNKLTFVFFFVFVAAIHGLPSINEVKDVTIGSFQNVALLAYKMNTVKWGSIFQKTVDNAYRMRNSESKTEKEAFFYILLAPLAIYEVHSLIAVIIGRSYIILSILNLISFAYPIYVIVTMHENIVTTGHNIKMFLTGAVFVLAVEFTVEIVNFFYQTGMVSSLIVVPISQISVALSFEVMKNKDLKE